jgi:hypothetical protein
MKLVRLSAFRTGRLYAPGNMPAAHFCESLKLTPSRPEGLCPRKIPVTPSRKEPATFRLVAQCLNHLCLGMAHNAIAQIVSVIIVMKASVCVRVCVRAHTIVFELCYLLNQEGEISNCCNKAVRSSVDILINFPQQHILKTLRT